MPVTRLSPRIRVRRVLVRTGTPKPSRAIHLPGARAVMRAFSSMIASGFRPAWRSVSRVEKATSSLPMTTGRSNGHLPWR